MKDLPVVLSEAIDQTTITSLLKAYADHVYARVTLKSECLSTVGEVVSAFMDRGMCTQNTMRDVVQHITNKTHTKPSQQELFLEAITKDIVATLGTDGVTPGCPEPSAEVESLADNILALKGMAPEVATYHENVSAHLGDRIGNQLTELKRQFGKLFDKEFLENF